MILYLDTSALVKLYLEEDGSDWLRRWTDEVEAVATSRVALAEAASAIARRARAGDLSGNEAQRIRRDMDRDWDHIVVIDVDERRASDLAFEHGIRGFDAIHLAAALDLAEQVEEADVRFACFDRALEKAAAACGFGILGAHREGAF